MRRLALALILSLFAAAAPAQTITLGSNTAWSTLSQNGALSLAGSNIALGSYTLTLDGTNTTYACASISSTNNGSIALGPSASTGCTISAGTLLAGPNGNLLTYAGTNTIAIKANYIATSGGQTNRNCISLTNSCTLNVNLTGTLTGGTSNISCGIFAASYTPTINITGGTLTARAAGGYALNAPQARINLNGCTVLFGGSPGTAGVYGNVHLTNCNLIWAAGGAPVTGTIVIASCSANNYVQFPTSTGGTLNMPAAATVMGPWSVTNSAQGTATSIGPWTITTDKNGNVFVGPYSVH